jgi:hypothetical protein
MDQIKNNKCISIMRFESRLKDDNQKKRPLGWYQPIGETGKGQEIWND